MDVSAVLFAHCSIVALLGHGTFDVGVHHAAEAQVDSPFIPATLLRSHRYCHHRDN